MNLPKLLSSMAAGGLPGALAWFDRPWKFLRLAVPGCWKLSLGFPAAFGRWRASAKVPLRFVLLCLLPTGDLRARTNVELALEDFAITVKNNFQTAYTTEESMDSALQYFELDVTGDGYNEIFVSRPDLSHHGEDNWMLYRPVAGLGAGIQKVGLLTINPSTVRPGERDGTRGYYQSYHRDDGNKDLLYFHAINADGKVEELFKQEIDSHGKDKEFWASTYPENHSEPKIRTTPVAAIRKKYWLANRASTERPKKALAQDRHSADAGKGAVPNPAGELDDRANRKTSVAIDRLKVLIIVFALAITAWLFRGAWRSMVRK